MDYIQWHKKEYPLLGLTGMGGGIGLGIVSGGTSTVFAGGDRGLFAGGRIDAGGGSSGATNRIDYINITSTGNGSDFGDISQRREGGAGNITNGSRCCFAGGYSYSDSNNYNIIDYVTSSSTGNASDFGDLTQAQDNMTGCADANIGRGFAGPSYQDMQQIEYITIATTGDAADFGTTTVDAHGAAATSDGIYGWWHGGRGSGGWGNATNVIGYLVTATLGDATDWGDLNFSGYAYSCTCSVADARIVQLGGYSQSNYRAEICYYTTASTGDASDFGDLTVGRAGAATTGNGTRAVAAGGYNSSISYADTIDYITIATTGDASDFGDLGEDRGWAMESSGSA